MPLSNARVAALLVEIADLLEIDGANTFRVRAYRDAARTVGALPRNLTGMLADGEHLDALPGIGADLAAKIATLAEGKNLPVLEALRARMSRRITALLALPGLGPKRVHRLHEALGIDSIEKLRAALAAGAVARLPGIGAAVADKLAAYLERDAGQTPRALLAAADDIVAPLLATLRSAPHVEQADVAGSCRRRRETVGDLDFVAAATDPRPLMQRFLGYQEVAEVRERGKTRASVLLDRGRLQVDLRAVKPPSYGAALLYFTGSQAHTIQIRELALQQGLTLNEYGLFKGSRRLKAESEAEIYTALGLRFIPPELREAEGEIEAARSGNLPDLLGLEDLRGDLHLHTNATDGHASLEEMVRAATARGYAYIAVTDHSQRMAMAHGLDVKRLAGQIAAIEKLNRELTGITVLAGIEVDILEDGTLDLPDSILRRLDLVVGSIHTRFELSGQAETERLLRAMDNRYLNIVGHPTGRLINRRAPYAIDMERVIKGALERGCYFEVNAQPERLDLSAHHCRLAKEIGLKLAISSDAHSPAGLAAIGYGVDQARRGWLEAADILNTRPLSELRKLLARN